MTNLPRDVFLYLLAIITLVAVSVSFGVVVFQMINVYIPDIVSDPYFSRSSYLSTARSSLAALVIVLPVFLWVSWFLRKDIKKFPEKKELKIRKWLLYVALFVAALVIIGDLVTLLRSFLEGELSQRFMLKVLAVLFIAGAVFVHYLSELKDKKHNWIKPFDWTVIAIVIAWIVSGFFVVGTPQSQRLVRLDERRVSDLQNIQWQIINYWQRKEVLPPDLKSLIDPIGGFTAPVDPETSEQYEYRVIGDLVFELCGVFNTSTSGEVVDNQRLTKPIPAGGYVGNELSNVWDHGAGDACFNRTIDPDLYPPIKAPKDFGR